MENYNAVQFVEENMKTIFAYSLARVSNKDDAEDLASDIMLAILQSGDKFKDSNAFYGYVWGIAANTYKSFLSKRNKSRYEEMEENLPSGEDFVCDICAREDINLLRRELSLLSREYRECTLAYYFDGLSCAETAKKLGISLEMVKYYLFKTRKILKEGIGMEREYGEKSYNPAKFNFVTIFSGKFNREYRNLFNRKLPGNIILSTYYTPMTIRELSLELGVAAPYLEDEIGLLEKYELIRNLGGGRYQANLVVFTEVFTKEFYKKAEVECTKKLSALIENAKSKLDKVRELGFVGNTLDDNRLLWAFLWMLMRRGHEEFVNSNPGFNKKTEIYNGATGINYGVDYDRLSDADDYGCDAFAGYAGIDANYAVSFADFGVLPEKNRYCLRTAEYKEKIYASISNPENAALVVMTPKQISFAESVFSKEINAMSEIYSYLNKTATEIMLIHAPNHVKEYISHIIGSTIFFRTAGLIGACAYGTGMLCIPDDGNALALYAYNTTENVANTDVLCE